MKKKRLVYDIETGKEKTEEFEQDDTLEFSEPETREDKIKRIDKAKTIKELKEIIKELI